MTAATLVRRPAVPAEVAAPAPRPRDGDAAVAQLVRFALAGGVATAVQVLLFALLAPAGALAANVASWAVSTVLANELHRRRTFRAGDRVGPLAAQLEGGGLAVAGLLASSSALTGFAAAVPAAGVGAQAAVVLGVTAAVGLVRFAALRWSFVLRPRLV